MRRWILRFIPNIFVKVWVLENLNGLEGELVFVSRRELPEFYDEIEPELYEDLAYRVLHTSKSPF